MNTILVISVIMFVVSFLVGYVIGYVCMMNRLMSVANAKGPLYQTNKKGEEYVIMKVEDEGLKLPIGFY